MNSSCPLNKMKKGACGVVSDVCCNDPVLCEKLVSMGLVRGATVEVLGTAPLGDPIQIRTKGYKLSLRKNEASMIEVNRTLEA